MGSNMLTDRAKAIESQVKLANISADDWQRRLRPARKALTDAERQQLELQQQRRKIRAELVAIEAGEEDASDMAYLQLKARAERLEAKIVRAGEDTAKARKTLADLEQAWHSDISRQRSEIVLAWRTFTVESEKAFMKELLSIG